jgi:hypothetical protein
MRCLTVSLLSSCFLFAVGCAPELAVVPRGGMDRVVAQVNGITLVAFGNQWDAYPNDLSDYVTPIAVELYNPGPSEVRVSYADLALRDASGFRYGAINPYLPAAAVGAATPAGAAPTKVSAAEGVAVADGAVIGSDGAHPLLLASNGPLLLAGRSGGGGARSAPAAGGFRGAPSSFHGGGMMRSPPPAGHFGGMRPIVPPPRGGVGFGGGYGGGLPGRHYGWGYSNGGWNGYLVNGGLRGYYGLGFGYWGGPWFYPPYYGDWVYGWGPTYYPSRPSTDVLSLGLPEGVLPPGARVSGFLYFKRATAAQQGGLDLSWDTHDARTGATLGTLHVPLDVVER